MPKAKSRIDRDARNRGKYLAIEVSVLRGADRSWAVSKARKQVAHVLVRRMGYRLKDWFGRFTLSQRGRRHNSHCHGCG